METLKIVKFAFLGGGLFLLLFGFIDLRSRKWGKYVCFIMMTIGIVCIYIPTLGPISKGEKYLKKIMEIDPTKVEAFVFKPSVRKSSTYEVSMYDKDQVIDDKDSIVAFCQCLNNMIDLGGSYKENNDRWVNRVIQRCLVEVNFKDQQSVSFGVVVDRGATIIKLASNGEFGWRFGNYQSYEFGALLPTSKKE